MGDSWHDGNDSGLYHWADLKAQDNGFTTALTLLPPPHPAWSHISTASKPLAFIQLHSYGLLLWPYMFGPLSLSYQLAFVSRILGFPWE